jgi:hypothetical protein
MKCYYSIIPLFLFGICRMGAGDSLLSTICRISDTSKLIESFCGVQGRFFQKEPLAAGGMFFQ